MLTDLGPSRPHRLVRRPPKQRVARQRPGPAVAAAHLSRRV